MHNPLSKMEEKKGKQKWGKRSNEKRKDTSFAGILCCSPENLFSTAWGASEEEQGLRQAVRKGIRDGLFQYLFLSSKLVQFFLRVYNPQSWSFADTFETGTRRVRSSVPSNFVGANDGRVQWSVDNLWSWVNVSRNVAHVKCPVESEMVDARTEIKKLPPTLKTWAPGRKISNRQKLEY